MCDIVEKEEEEIEREREKGKGGFMSFLSRADISRDDYYVCVRCLSGCLYRECNGGKRGL